MGFRGPVNPAQFYSPPQEGLAGSIRISGITKNSTGTALGLCTVDLYRTCDDLLVAKMTSDANGNYAFDLSPLPLVTYYVVAYKAGSPDVAGTTLNTLVGS